MEEMPDESVEGPAGRCTVCKGEFDADGARRRHPVCGLEIHEECLKKHGISCFCGRPTLVALTRQIITARLATKVGCGG